MNLEVLVTTMHATNFDKYNEMNLQTDAIIANQADHCSYEETIINGHTVKMITTNTRGTSINRNMALSYATADYIMFADDDMIFENNYLAIIENEWKKKDKIDAIRFRSDSLDPSRPLSTTKQKKFTHASYTKIIHGGVCALVVNRKVLLKKNILFAIGYGPSQDISNGEDSIFLKQIHRNIKNFYTTNSLIANIKREDSTWFRGYTEKYFYNVGYLHSALYGRLAYLSTLRRAYKFSKKKEINYTLCEMFRFMKKGIKSFYS